MLVHWWPLLQWDEGFGCWRSVAKRAVRPLGVVVTTPLFDDDLGFLEGVEDLSVEQFVSEPGIEAFYVSVLPG